MKTFYGTTFQPIGQKQYFLLFILCMLLNTNTNAQNSYWTDRSELKKPFIYSEAYAGMANAGFVGLGQNVILGNQWGIHVGYIKGSDKSKEQPTDYHGPTGHWGAIPKDHFQEYSFRIARTFSLNKARIRFKGELGLASVNYKAVHFNPYTVTSNGVSLWDWLFGTNYGTGNTTTTTYYNTNYTHEKNLGLSTRLVTEFNVSRVFGFQLALQGTFTKKHTFLGLSTGISLGRVRDKFQTY